ncbi:MAG: YeeE/YedE family protein [Betaproteobacteria bacterium]|nr:YeeE/YedE family protein [Betaproteobacteria bacterium]
MSLARLLCVLAGGALFGLGLAVSTMVQPEVVISFLRLKDLGLLAVLGSAVMTTLVAYQLAPRLLKRPLLGGAFQKHAVTPGARTILGAAIFGVGWGLSGVCPGPAVAGLGTGNWPLLLALAGLFAGAWVQGRFFAR